MRIVFRYTVGIRSLFPLVSGTFLLWNTIGMCLVNGGYTLSIRYTVYGGTLWGNQTTILGKKLKG